MAGDWPQDKGEGSTLVAWALAKFDREEGRDVVQGIGRPPIAVHLVGSGARLLQIEGLALIQWARLASRCSYITDRLYNFNKTGKPDPNMDSSFLAQMRKQCPPNSESQGDPQVFLDPASGSSYTFSNSFYTRLLNHQAVLGVDQQLALGKDTSQIAQGFDAGFKDFRKVFALSMNRMGNIGVLTGDQGEIRKSCRAVNGK